ncbi:MAG: choice-of-anchor J domain-containing protein, partial [Candidatus Delongbacteria bacterium]|nr:choice-of-anchor J domain-containing protein [Candidatus Delongbacteria bacterium]
MKKLMLLIIALLATGVFSADWYTKKDFVTDIKTHSAGKDTTWNTYAKGESGYYWNPIVKERATYYDVGDFGLSYPININGVSVYCIAADTNYTFSYKIYAKDGVTMLWQSDPTVSIAYDNDVFLDIPMEITDDFWVSVVPDGAGYPRVFSSLELGADPALTRTYLKANDGSWNPFTDGTDYYEMFAYVQLSTYEGVDTLVPVIREISGTEVFMLRDMDISITLHEQNAIVSPMQAQYNVGAGWIDFNMTQAKNTYTFTGTIPGQAGGVAGQVKFYLADDQGNSAWSGEYPILWSKDLPMFSEGFEGDVFPPEGWTLQSVGAGFTRGSLADGGFVYEGIYSAVHWDNSGEQDDWLITPALSLPTDDACTFSFWQTVFWSYYYSFSEVCISTDMVNWTQVYLPPYIAGDGQLSLLQDAVWIPVKFSLGAWAGQQVYVGFHYTGDYNHQWYIDNVEMLYDYEGPQIASLVGNTALSPVIGAYLNNPMVLTIDATDKSGVKSITGHYDIGGIVDDVIFSKAKDASEIWTGSISAQAAEAIGAINFTLVDIGDIVADTDDYEIEFVADMENPVIKYLVGNETFIDSTMNLELTFYDESVIA